MRQKTLWRLKFAVSAFQKLNSFPQRERPLGILPPGPEQAQSRQRHDKCPFSISFPPKTYVWQPAIIPGKMPSALSRTVLKRGKKPDWTRAVDGLLGVLLTCCWSCGGVTVTVREPYIRGSLVKKWSGHRPSPPPRGGKISHSGWSCSPCERRYFEYSKAEHT